MMRVVPPSSLLFVAKFVDLRLLFGIVEYIFIMHRATEYISIKRSPIFSQDENMHHIIILAEKLSTVSGYHVDKNVIS